VDTIDIDPAVDYYKHNDSAKKAIGQIRHRLATVEFKTGFKVTFMMKG
jgi:hypothetical protein